MVTRYQCKGCKKTFDDEDPVHYGETSTPTYPFCPDGPMAKYLADLDKPEGEREVPDDLIALIDKDERLHPVSLAIVNVVDLPTGPTAPKTMSWAKIGTNPESDEQRVRRLREEEQRRRRRAVEERERQADSLARQLVGRVERMISSGGYTVSSNFPMDREYGTKPSGSQLSASADTIRRAGTIWRAQADCSFRAPAYKQLWKQYQANFEQLIVSGQPDSGKHNVHVVRT